MILIPARLYFFRHQEAFRLNEDPPDLFLLAAVRSHASVGEGGGGSELNTPHNTDSMEPMTALWHAFPGRLWKVCVEMLLRRDMFLQSDGGLLWGGSEWSV